MEIKKLGKFGEFVKQYEKARRLYPIEVFKFLSSLSKVKKPLILDLGCGTGISSRQLTKIGTVIGCDPDAKMLKAARAHKNSGVKEYILGRADKLPFKDEAFDAVTAFSAFHWFTDKKSMTEIKRVLKPGGILFVVNKFGILDWGREYRNVIIKAIDREVPGFRGGEYNPREIFKKSPFKSIKYRQWWKSEFFTVTRALEYVQSVSIWNGVPKSLRPKALAAVKKYYQNVLKRKGKIERRLKVSVVAGTKP